MTARDTSGGNDGAIALGHPSGCSGAGISIILKYEMERRAGDAGRPFHGLATPCVGVGMGGSTLVQRIGI